MRTPAAARAELVTAATGRTPANWHLVVGGGYTPAERWIVTFGDGSRAFAKFGTTELVASWLRRERRAYADIAGSFMPNMLGWADGPIPVLVLEDLSDAHWPPPWRPGDIDRVLSTLERVAASPCPAWAAPIEGLGIFDGWSRIAADPGPFLALGIASVRWLDSALPALVEAEARAPLAGPALVHLDVRSDNVCIRGTSALLVDWNHVTRGNALFDLAAWLPSLALEGGPLPEEVRREAGLFASCLAGYFCSHAGLPDIPDAPRVRRVQLDQAMTSLPWAARWLGLPPPDGPLLASRS